MKIRAVVLALLALAPLTACKPLTPTSPSASVPAIPAPAADDDPLAPDDRGPAHTEPRGPGWKIGDVYPGDKVVTAAAWVFNKSGDPIHARVTMVFNAVVQVITGADPQINVRGNQQWDSQVDSGYRWPSAIRAGFPYSIVFEVSVTYVGGRAGDKVSCVITSGGGVIMEDMREVFGTAPTTAHCFVSVLPPPALPR